jgi:hypothetical protein
MAAAAGGRILRKVPPPAAALLNRLQQNAIRYAEQTGGKSGRWLDYGLPSMQLCIQVLECPAWLRNGGV